MAASHQELILSTLQELGKESFKTFKAFLRDEELLGGHGYSPVSLLHLEGKDCVDVAERLISHYTRDGALRVTAIILEKIQQNQLAERLRTCSYANTLTNIINILANNLNRLSKDRFKAFIVDFCGLRVPPGCNPIQREDLEGKSPMKVAEIIINSYTKRHGPAKVKQALRNINENQIRIDLEKELKATSWTSCGKISVAHQKPNVGALKSFTTLKTPTENAQPMGGPTGCTPGKSQQPGEDKKAEIGSHPKTAPEIGDGDDRSPDQKQNVGARKTSKILKKPNVNAQPKGRPAGRKPRKSQRPGEDIKPEIGSDPTAPRTGSGEIPVEDQKMNVGEEENSKINVQPPEDSTAPETGGGQDNVEDQKPNVGARKSSKPSKKPTVDAQPMGGPTGCTAGKGQKPGEDIKNEIRRKPTTESKSTEKTNVKAKISSGGADCERGMEELSVEDVKPKRGENKKKKKGNT